MSQWGQISGLILIKGFFDLQKINQNSPMGSEGGLTFNISNKNRKAIEFSQSINSLNNQSMVKMSGNLKELTMDINNLMETTPISIETINSVIKNIEDTAIEIERHKKEILDKLNANISQTKDAISRLVKE